LAGWDANAHVNGLRPKSRHLGVPSTVECFHPLLAIISLHIAHSKAFNSAGREIWKADIEAHAWAKAQGVQPVGTIQRQHKVLIGDQPDLHADDLVPCANDVNLRFLWQGFAYRRTNLRGIPGTTPA
jgi:hypothetical protein